MSVLVEAISLIVPRKVLDVRYPGGADEFIKKMGRPDAPCRLVCADDHLVSASFEGVPEATFVGTELLEVGIVATNYDHFEDMAFVNQFEGPTIRCDWLEWRQHEDGFSYCWPAGTDPGPLCAPENWTPDQSRGIVRHDVRDLPGRCLELAEENGLETWIDFQTGDLFEAPARRKPT